MAKLFTATAVLSDYTLLNPPTTVYLNPKNVKSADSVQYRDASGNTNTGVAIDCFAYDATFRRVYTVSEAPSTINTRMNAANTTDVYRIPLTRKNADGTTTAITVNVDDIFYMQKHPDNNADTLMMIQNPTRDQIDSIKVDETAAAILALAVA